MTFRKLYKISANGYRVRVLATREDDWWPDRSRQKPAAKQAERYRWWYHPRTSAPWYYSRCLLPPYAIPPPTIV